MKFWVVLVFFGGLTFSSFSRAADSIPEPVISYFIEVFIYGKESTNYEDVETRRWNKGITFKIITLFTLKPNYQKIINLPEAFLSKVREFQNLSDKIENLDVLNNREGDTNFLILAKDDIASSLSQEQWDVIRDEYGSWAVTSINEQIRMGEKCFSVVLGSQRGYEKAIVGVDTSLETRGLDDCLSRHFLATLGYLGTIGKSHVTGIDSVLNPDYQKLEFSEIDVLALKFLYGDRSGMYGELLRRVER